VRSWKLAARRESASVICAWLSHPEEPIPREVLAQELEGLASALRLFVPVLYACIERPIGPREDDRVEEAHTAIEQVLDASGLRAESRPAAEAILQLLIFRDEDGKAEDFDLSELLEPIRQTRRPICTTGWQRSPYTSHPRVKWRAGSGAARRSSHDQGPIRRG
jgi:hypothetical protein